MKFQNARKNFRITLYHALIPSKYLKRVKFPTHRCTTRLLRQFVGVLSLTLKDPPRLLLEHLRKEGFFVKPSLPKPLHRSPKRKICRDPLKLKPHQRERNGSYMKYYATSTSLRLETIILKYSLTFGKIYPI